MAHVDFFSRNYLPEVNSTTVRDTLLDIGKENYVEEKLINIAELSSNWLQAEQRLDPEYNEIIT